jgi:hypothetical protein
LHEWADKTHTKSQTVYQAGFKPSWMWSTNLHKYTTDMQRDI